MFLLLLRRLTEVFAECGISFRIVPHFKGAPVQGFIKKLNKGHIILCITLRQKFADIFWFTLFHEIAHIIYGDTTHTFIDMDSISEKNEKRADIFSRDTLINSIEYNSFVESNGYERMIEIKRFAKQQNVKEFVVLGRLMKDNYIPWQERTKYDWV